MKGAGVAQCTCSVRERRGQLCLDPNCNSASPVTPMGCLDCIWERTCGARMGVANG